MACRGIEVLNLDSGQWAVSVDKDRHVFCGTYTECEDLLDFLENTTRNQGNADNHGSAGHSKSAGNNTSAHQAPRSLARRVLLRIRHFLKAEEGATTHIEAVLVALVALVAFFLAFQMAEVFIARASQHLPQNMLQSRQYLPASMLQSRYSGLNRFNTDDCDRVDMVCAAATYTVPEHQAPPP